MYLGDNLAGDECLFVEIRRLAARPRVGVRAQPGRSRRDARQSGAGSTWALLDFPEDLLQRLVLLPQVVQLGADVAELEVGVLLRRDSKIGQATVLLS